MKVSEEAIMELTKLVEVKFIDILAAGDKLAEAAEELLTAYLRGDDDDQAVDALAAALDAWRTARGQS